MALVTNFPVFFFDGFPNEWNGCIYINDYIIISLKAILTTHYFIVIVNDSEIAVMVTLAIYI